MTIEMRPSIDQVPSSLSGRDKAAGGALVAVVILVQTSVMGRAIIALNVGLLVAYFFWAAGSCQRASATRVFRWYAVGLGCFTCTLMRN